MKHILNNLTEQEKQSILEQHKGGMKVMNENFSKLIKATLGDAKPLVNEQTTSNPKEMVRQIFNKAKSVKAYSGFGQQPCQALDWAMEGPGTNEDDIAKIFSNDLGTDLRNLSSTIEYWRDLYDGELFDRLDSEIDLDSDWAKILKPLQKLK
jgi:hypothetical protein